MQIAEKTTISSKQGVADRIQITEKFKHRTCKYTKQERRKEIKSNKAKREKY